MLAITAAILTETTCGEACWHAKEDICRCCCGGKNHGILLAPDGVQPTRTAKIDGYRYELIAAGRGKTIIGLCRQMLRDLPPKHVEEMASYDGKFQQTYTYPWRETEPGSPIRLRSATPQQAAAWPELSEFKGMTVQDWYFASPYTLWKLVTQ